jgi:hypothetical protein
MNAPARSGIPVPVFIAGIKYHSLFEAGIESGISSVGLWKALKKTSGGPVVIKKSFVVLESWVYARIEEIRGWV